MCPAQQYLAERRCGLVCLQGVWSWPNFLLNFASARARSGLSVSLRELECRPFSAVYVPHTPRHQQEYW